MMKEEHFRNKVYWLTFLFSLLVVWVHSYNAELYLGRNLEMHRLYQIEHFFGDRLAQIAVPGFFMISGYLFYREFTLKKLWTKWKSRMKSILVPYIVWNSIYYLGYVIASRLPWMKEVVGKGEIPIRLDVAVDAILHYTYNYVFWYLYQLILLILLAPLIYLAINNVYIGIAWLAAVSAVAGSGFSVGPVNGDALLYYSAAAYMALHGRKLVEREWSLKQMGAGLCLFLTGICCLCSADRTGEIMGVILYRFLTPAALWLLLPEQLLPRASNMIKNNFFLYATHFAFVRFLNKAGARILPAVPMVPAFVFLVMPFLVWIISSVIGSMMRKRTPRIWTLLNGGR